MDIAALIGSMRLRMPWPVGQRILRENDLPRGHGWENTVERLTDPEADYSDKSDAIASALKEHLLCGEKLVRFYDVSKKASVEMRGALRGAKIAESSFRDFIQFYSRRLSWTIIQLNQN